MTSVTGVDRRIMMLKISEQGTHQMIDTPLVVTFFKGCKNGQVLKICDAS